MSRGREGEQRGGGVGGRESGGGGSYPISFFTQFHSAYVGCVRVYVIEDRRERYSLVGWDEVLPAHPQIRDKSGKGCR